MAKYKTEQRKLLLDLFSAHPHEMFSASEISSRLGCENVSISAVYRNVSALEAEGLLRRCTKAGSRTAFYQYTATEDCREHIHLTCTSCGKVIHMSNGDSDLLAKNARKYKDFSLDRCETVLYGICGKCRGKRSV